MQQHTESTDGRRYAAGDAVKVRVVLDHKPHLKEIRLAFVHEADKRAVIMVKGEPPLSSERTAGGWRRSSLEAEVTIPRGRPSGLYRLHRIGYETAVGRVGLLFEAEGVLEASLLTFEVTREPEDMPEVVEVAFVGD